MTLSAARKRVYEACLQMIEDRLVVGSAGNISERVDEDRFVVSPGGVAYAEVTAADFPVVSIASGESKGPLKPTSELWLHRALYEAFPDTDAIVHTHSKYAAAFAVARIDLPFICNENIGPASEFVLVTDYGAPGTDTLGLNAVATFQRQPGSRAVLLANHGVVAMGVSVEMAYTIAAQVEWIAEVTHHASLLQPELSGVVVIPDDQQDLIAKNYGFTIARHIKGKWS